MGFLGCSEDNTILLLLILFLFLCNGTDFLGSLCCGEEKGLTGLLPLLLIFFLIVK